MFLAGAAVAFTAQSNNACGDDLAQPVRLGAGARSVPSLAPAIARQIQCSKWGLLTKLEKSYGKNVDGQVEAIEIGADSSGKAETGPTLTQ